MLRHNYSIQAITIDGLRASNDVPTSIGYRFTNASFDRFNVITKLQQLRINNVSIPRLNYFQERIRKIPRGSLY